jgi:hypothetical protein
MPPFPEKAVGLDIEEYLKTHKKYSLIKTWAMIINIKPIL